MSDFDDPPRDWVPPWLVALGCVTAVLISPVGLAIGAYIAYRGRVGAGLAIAGGAALTIAVIVSGNTWASPYA